MAGEQKDYWLAFVIGAIVGLGALLLMSPEPRRRSRVARFRKKLRRMR